MADSKPLFSLDGNPVAAEALLRDVFGLVVNEVIRKGTSASEKVGLFSLLFLPIKPGSELSSSNKATPQNSTLFHCEPQGLFTGSYCLFTHIHVSL